MGSKVPTAAKIADHATEDDRDWRNYGKELNLNTVALSALKAFNELGYHGTGVRDIAQRSGISVPGLYYHFASKHEILVALLSYSSEDIMRRARIAVTEGGDNPRMRFMLLVENIILYMSNRRRLADLAHEIQFLEEPFKNRHIERRDELENMIYREVIAACEQDLFCTIEPREATRAVWLMCRGVAGWFRPGGKMSPSEVAQTYVKFALGVVQDRKLACETGA